MNANDNIPRNQGGADTGAPGALDWARHPRRMDRFLATYQLRLRRHQRRRRVTAGVGLMAMLVAGGLAWRTLRPMSIETRATTAAVVSEPRRQVLPDGTKVFLQPDSELTAAFTPDLRRVILRGGVAHFEVAKNEAKDFVVVAEGVEVRAVGTAFSVSLAEETIEVLVTEGRVALERPAGKPDTGAAGRAAGHPFTMGFAEAGNRVLIERRASDAVLAVESVSEQVIAEKLAWRVPRLEFNGTRLSEAVAMINRYSPVRLHVAEARAGEVEISGVLRADNLEPLLVLLEAHYGLAVTRDADGISLALAR